MANVKFYKINKDLPEYKESYEGIFVYTTTNSKYYLGTAGGWKELTNEETPQIDDNTISSDSLWSSQKINSLMFGIYHFRGSVSTYSDLPGSETNGGRTLEYSDENGTGSVVFRCGMIWNDVESGLLQGLKLTLEPGTGTTSAWFRNTETWTRQDNTNISIDGSTLVDLGGFTATPSNVGVGVSEVTITFNNSVLVSSSSIITFDCITWGSQLDNGNIHDNGYILITQNLPVVLNKIGDVWNVRDTDMNYGWTGSEWDALGSSTDDIGDISGLTTDEKTNLVGSINELNEKI